MIARRDPEFANQLYPFHLQYEEGRERLGCDSAIERGKFSGMNFRTHSDGSPLGQCHLERFGPTHGRGVAISSHPFRAEWKQQLSSRWLGVDAL